MKQRRHAPEQAVREVREGGRHAHPQERLHDWRLHARQRQQRGGGGGDGGLSGLPASGGGDTPRRQHYAPAMLLKQWGDHDERRDTVIGRFDMHTPQTSTCKAGEERVFEGVLGARDGGQAFLAAI